MTCAKDGRKLEMEPDGRVGGAMGEVPSDCVLASTNLGPFCCSNAAIACRGTDEASHHFDGSEGLRESTLHLVP